MTSRDYEETARPSPEQIFAKLMKDRPNIKDLPGYGLANDTDRDVLDDDDEG